VIGRAGNVTTWLPDAPLIAPSFATGFLYA
jgi:hypothetical protein